MNKSNVGANTNSIQIIADIFVGAFAYLLASWASGGIVGEQIWVKYFILYVVFMFIYILSNKEERVYNITTFYYTDRIFKRLSKSFLTAVFITSAMMFYVGQAAVSRKFYLFFLIFSYSLLAIHTFTFRMFYSFFDKKDLPRVLWIGKVGEFDKLRYFMNKTSIRVNTVGYVSMEKQDTEGCIGMIDELESLIRKYNIDQIYIMQKTDNMEQIQPYLDLCIEMGVTARVVMDFYKARNTNSYVSSMGTYPVITYHTISLNNYEMLLKRTMDIVGGLTGLILFSPIMLITAIAISLDSPGPVIFKQERVGMNGRHFKMYKFRSMYLDAEERKKELMAQNEIEGGFMFKIKDDPRITKVGKWIRKTSIDELPQFFNIVKGEMSLVGTRPPTLDEVGRYDRSHWRRISIKPGLTGMWQVSGRSEITDFEEIVKLDTKYIDNWSIWLDVRILFQTVSMVVCHKGAY